MSFLSWISDEKLLDAFVTLADSIKRGKDKAENDRGRNIIDPFSAIFTLSFFEMNHLHWLEMEVFRQAEKSLTNAIGNFHQQILGSVDGWQNLGTKANVDIVNAEREIIAEIKNKFNTVKGADRINIYNSLHDCIYGKVSRYKGYKAYYVTIIPQKPEGICRPFAPSDSKSGKKPPEDENIMEIDGKRFYSLVTGAETAMEDLFKVIPQILATDHFHLRLDDESKVYVNKLFRWAFSRK
ncbi:MAG: Eco47II family restriction endonuclease [Oligosphaeraceae bacterium]|nr:Eco47II family restriction endonuclease [Oligosphaeraceae bacterium]